MVSNIHFGVTILVSLAAFYWLVIVTLHRRAHLPSRTAIGGVSAIVVIGGLLFAKVGATAGWPVWLYYGVPAALTWFLPPAAFRMVRRELLQYVVLAVLLAPSVHVAFSFFLGWNEYMPFIPVPSVRELLGIAA